MKIKPLIVIVAFILSTSALAGEKNVPNQFFPRVDGGNVIVCEGFPFGDIEIKYDLVSTGPSAKEYELKNFQATLAFKAPGESAPSANVTLPMNPKIMIWDVDDKSYPYFFDSNDETQPFIGIDQTRGIRIAGFRIGGAILYTVENHTPSFYNSFIRTEEVPANKESVFNRNNPLVCKIQKK